MPSEATSPFLNPGYQASDNSLAVLYLRREQMVSVKLSSFDDEDEGYDEGKVTNTRFGSFPHSTIIGLPWGSQIRASRVDTGSRGRKGYSKKRKLDSLNETLEIDEPSSPSIQDEINETQNISSQYKIPVAADTGFIYVLPPTPESWTTTLPHRTQVVYTPDYSYILHRLQVRPGVSVIEAGAGSGSFTHAAARSCFRGLTSGNDEDNGKVFSFEFHRPRFEKLDAEVQDHHLEGIVRLAHRDVCLDGFSVGSKMNVRAIFLDLPAPWLALPHLKRNGQGLDKSKDSEEQSDSCSVLHPKFPVHICCFSPCIEQTQKTVETLRQYGWIEIEMVDLSQRRIEVRCESNALESNKSQSFSPSTVDEAVSKLKDMENQTRNFHNGVLTKEKRYNTSSPVDRKNSCKGRLVHHLEHEVKNHTSYLVFAVLPS